MFGGGDGYKVTAVFENAGQLVKGNPVLVGGGAIGTIDEHRARPTTPQAVVTIKLDDDYAPLHQGTTATIRATSLSGIANRYVSLQPGPNNSDEIADGGQIGADDTARAGRPRHSSSTRSTKRTRAGLQNVIRGSATSTTARASRPREATKYFSPALVAPATLTRELACDQEVLERFVTDTSEAVTAIAERRDDLLEPDQRTPTRPSGRSATRARRWRARSTSSRTRCARPTPRS